MTRITAKDLNYNGCKQLACEMVVGGIEVYKKCASLYKRGKKEPHRLYAEMLRVWRFIKGTEFDAIGDAFDVDREDVLAKLRAIKNIDEMAREIAERDKVERKCRNCKYGWCKNILNADEIMCRYERATAEKNGATQKETREIPLVKVSDGCEHWTSARKWRNYDTD